MLMAGRFFMTLSIFHIFPEKVTGVLVVVNRFYAFGQIAEKGRLWTETNGCPSIDS
jgi:hypothetical protein